MEMERCCDFDGNLCYFICGLIQEYHSFLRHCSFSRLGMSVTMQGGSGRQYVTGPGRNISKNRFVLLNVYRFREI